MLRRTIENKQPNYDTMYNSSFVIVTIGDFVILTLLSWESEFL